MTYRSDPNKGCGLLLVGAIFVVAFVIPLVFIVWVLLNGGGTLDFMLEWWPHG